MSEGLSGEVSASVDDFSLFVSPALPWDYPSSYRQSGLQFHARKTSNLHTKPSATANISTSSSSATSIGTSAPLHECCPPSNFSSSTSWASVQGGSVEALNHSASTEKQRNVTHNPVTLQRPHSTYAGPRASAAWRKRRKATRHHRAPLSRSRRRWRTYATCCCSRGARRASTTPTPPPKRVRSPAYAA
jgi:hypothetical protein